jgi:hypothetical protein
MMSVWAAMSMPTCRTLFHLATSISILPFDVELETFARQIGAVPGSGSKTLTYEVESGRSEDGIAAT